MGYDATNIVELPFGEAFNVKHVFFPKDAPFRQVFAMKVSDGYMLKIAGTGAFSEIGNIIGKNAYDQACKSIISITEIILGAASHYGINLENALYTITSTVVYAREPYFYPEIDRAYKSMQMPQVARTFVVASLPIKILVEISAEAFVARKQDANPVNPSEVMTMGIP